MARKKPAKKAKKKAAAKPAARKAAKKTMKKASKPAKKAPKAKKKAAKPAKPAAKKAARKASKPVAKKAAGSDSESAAKPKPAPKPEPDNTTKTKNGPLTWGNWQVVGQPQIEKNGALEMYDVKLRVKNIGDSEDQGLFTMTLLKGDNVLATVDCNTADGIAKGATTTANRTGTTATVVVQGHSLSVIPGWSPVVRQVASVPVERLTAP